MRLHNCTGDDCRFCEARAEQMAEERDYDSWQIGQDRYERYLDQIGGSL